MTSERPVFQHSALTDAEGAPIQNVAEAARVFLADVRRVAEAAEGRYRGAVQYVPDRERVHISTALEELRKVQDTATWSIRMLVEMAGIERREAYESEARRKYPSQREMVQAAGVSLATVHSWIHNPAIVVDGRSGPGTLPRPGQTNHGRVASRSKFGDEGSGNDLDYEDDLDYDEGFEYDDTDAF
ncbi:hypothetical protein ACLTEW_24305 [Gordonia lacunae]|uniref:hypothetical protein n=1 Tax=Gordonia TaxID=2053 RepID=UPI00200B15E3|nr:hypothetical protein [Gordonia terrae]UPW11991.1 hypothetical protein M1C59_25895 [Gordonia terrae]